MGARYNHSPLLVNENEFVFETTSNEDSLFDSGNDEYLECYGGTVEWRSQRGSARTRCGPPIPSCLGMRVRGLVV